MDISPSAEAKRIKRANWIKIKSSTNASVISKIVLDAFMASAQRLLTLDENFERAADELKNPENAQVFFPFSEPKWRVAIAYAVLAGCDMEEIDKIIGRYEVYYYRTPKGGLLHNFLRPAMDWAERQRLVRYRELVRAELVRRRSGKLER